MLYTKAARFLALFSLVMIDSVMAGTLIRFYELLAGSPYNRKVCNTEPLSLAREHAEQYLVDGINVTKNELRSLNCIYCNMVRTLSPDAMSNSKVRTSSSTLSAS